MGSVDAYKQDSVSPTYTAIFKDDHSLPHLTLSDYFCPREELQPNYTYTTRKFLPSFYLGHPLLLYMLQSITNLRRHEYY